MNIQKMKSFSILPILTLLLAGCGGGGGNGGVSTSDLSAKSDSLFASGFSGVAQKGPLIFGSEITIYELDGNLQQTGRSFDAQTTDDLGNFKVSANLATNLVSMVGVGYYMDELTGGLSSAPITLSAIADLSVDPTPTINILTTLATPRTKALMQSGKTYSESITQAQREVLAVFGIDASKVDGLQALYAMNISGSSDQDGALLATSAVLSQMASNAAIGGSSPAAQMSYYLSRIASDVANYGELRSTSIKTALTTAETQVDLSLVRTNVQTYYANRGLAITAPKFEEWIDKSNSGVLPQRLVPTTAFNFNANTVEINTSNTSNAITVAGLASGTSAQVYISGASNATNTPGTGNHRDWKIIKNSAVVSGSYTSVNNGDTLAMQLTADGFGSTVSVDMHVGSSAATWSVTTRKPKIFYSNQSTSANGNGTCSGLGAHNYYAVPFMPVATSQVNYLGIGVGASSAPDAIAIHADASGSPDALPLVSTNTISAGGYFLGDGYLKSDGSAYSSGFAYPQAQLSSSGAATTLQANTIYWIVMKWNSGGTPLCNFASGSNPISSNYNTNYKLSYSDDGASWSRASTYPHVLPGHFLAD